LLNEFTIRFQTPSFHFFCLALDVDAVERTHGLSRQTPPRKITIAADQEHNDHDDETTKAAAKPLASSPSFYLTLFASLHSRNNRETAIATTDPFRKEQEASVYNNAARGTPPSGIQGGYQSIKDPVRSFVLLQRKR